MIFSGWQNRYGCCMSKGQCAAVGQLLHRTRNINRMLALTNFAALIYQGSCVQIMAVPPDVYKGAGVGADNSFPPMLFVHMVRDGSTGSGVAQDVAVLTAEVGASFLPFVALQGQHLDVSLLLPSSPWTTKFIQWHADHLHRYLLTLVGSNRREGVHAQSSRKEYMLHAVMHYKHNKPELQNIVSHVLGGTAFTRGCTLVSHCFGICGRVRQPGSGVLYNLTGLVCEAGWSCDKSAPLAAALSDT